MNISKIAASALLVAFSLSAGSAVAASTPSSPSIQQMQCLNDGGSFAVIGADSYTCDQADGTLQTCSFAGGPVCVFKDGQADHGKQKTYHLPF
jgi:hypothetical protein